MTFFKTVCAFALVALLPVFLHAAEGNEAKSPTAEEKGANAESNDAEAPVDSGFERYRTILDRMPFGPEPANFDPDTPGSRGGVGGDGAGEVDSAAQEAMKSQEEQKLLASVRVSALNVTPSGKVAVGFTDASKQPAGTYYLKVGETRDGWTVKAADAREMKVTLEKDGVEATLGLGEGNADAGKDGKKGKGAGGAMRPPVGRLARAGLLRPAAHKDVSQPAVAGGGSAIANLRARRAQKEAERKEEEARQAAAAEQEKADREKAAAERERAAAEREQQRETLLQIQEELRRQREAKELQQGQDGDQNE